MTTAGNRTRETVQQVLQSQWRKLGIDVRIRNEPARVFFGETMRKRQFPAMGMFAWISTPGERAALDAAFATRSRSPRTASPARTRPASAMPRWTG